MITLPASLYTPQQLALTIAELKQLSGWYNHERIKHVVKGKPKVTATPELSPSSQDLVTIWQAKRPLTAKSIEGLITKLEELQAEAPRLSLTLAAAPAEGLRQQLVQWLRDQIHPQALVSFGFSSEILGGMVLRSQSRIFDWSLRRAILAEQGRFAEVLRRV